MNSQQVKLVVVGSIGIDDIETPVASRERILGGSASYACAAASFFTQTGMVGVVGTDFNPEYKALYEHFNIDLLGLQVEEGETFRWGGVYEENMDNRTTTFTHLNVFETFSPELPDSYKTTPFLFLANIAPALQRHVLEQAENPKFVVADTMDLWINIAKDDLVDLIGRVDLLTLNESEARHLTGENGLLRAAQAILDMGPRHVLIKKGEHGSMLFSANGIFLMPAFPLEQVADPTGAGDTFAGGFMGALASMGEVTEANLRHAMLYGSVVASFGVEAFSLERLEQLNRPELDARAQLLHDMLRVD